jgi:hypothetical protein
MSRLKDMGNHQNIKNVNKIKVIIEQSRNEVVTKWIIFKIIL